MLSRQANVRGGSPTVRKGAAVVKQDIKALPDGRATAPRLENSTETDT